MTDIVIPAGFVRNAIGHWGPLDLVREHHKLHDGVAHDLGAEAEQFGSTLARFKKTLADVAGLVAVSSELYGVTLGG